MRLGLMSYFGVPGGGEGCSYFKVDRAGVGGVVREQADGGGGGVLAGGRVGNLEQVVVVGAGAVGLLSFDEFRLDAGAVERERG